MFLWLIWIATFFVLQAVGPAAVMLYTIFVSFYGPRSHPNLKCKQMSMRKYIRHFVNLESVIDERLMVLLAVMIYADLAYIFC